MCKRNTEELDRKATNPNQEKTKPIDYSDVPIQINFRGKTYQVNTSESGNGLLLEKI